MMRPQTIPGCPVGLEYLTQIDTLMVNQQVEMLESMYRLLSFFFFKLTTKFFILINFSSCYGLRDRK